MFHRVKLNIPFKKRLFQQTSNSSLNQGSLLFSTMCSYLRTALEINLLEQNSFCKNNKIDYSAVQLTKEEYYFAKTFIQRCMFCVTDGHEGHNGICNAQCNVIWYCGLQSKKIEKHYL